MPDPEELWHDSVQHAWRMHADATGMCVMQLLTGVSVRLKSKILMAGIYARACRSACIDLTYRRRD